MKAIAAMSLNRVIGAGGQIPWHLPADFRWFKQATSGQSVLMGRKTFESLGRPLPGRLNLVVTRQRQSIAGATLIHDLGQFDPQTYAPQEVWLIGGAELYGQLLDCCTDLYLSVVQREVTGDAYFPLFEDRFDRVSTVLHESEFEVLHYRNRSLSHEKASTAALATA